MRKPDVFLVLFALHILSHYRCNVLRAASLFGVVLLALAAGAGASHTADVIEGFCTLLHCLDYLTLGYMVAVTNKLIVFHAVYLLFIVAVYIII